MQTNCDQFLGPNGELVEVGRSHLGHRISRLDLQMQFEAFHVPRDLETNLLSLQQVRTLSTRFETKFGLDAGRMVNEYEALAPIANQFANKAPNDSDCSALSWRRALALTAGHDTRKNKSHHPNLQQF